MGKTVNIKKIAELCNSGLYPVLKKADGRVEIGKKGSQCILSRADWETLKVKHIDKEI